MAEKLHLLGMFGVFMFSAIMLTALTVYYKRAMNRSYQALEQAQQAIHGQRRILAVSSLAANIAHEMSTPIASMQLLTDDIIGQLDEDDELVDDIKILQSQIAVCSQSLSVLKKQIQQSKNEDTSAALASVASSQLDILLPKLVEDWRFINPHIQVELQPLTTPICVKLNEEQLYSILINVLNNAMQAGATVLMINVKVHNLVSIIIDDNGHGNDDKTIERIHQHGSVNSDKGWGLGLTLAKTVLAYAGGGLDIGILGSANNPKGTRITLRLPNCQPSFNAT